MTKEQFRNALKSAMGGASAYAVAPKIGIGRATLKAWLAGTRCPRKHLRVFYIEQVKGAIESI